MALLDTVIAQVKAQITAEEVVAACQARALFLSNASMGAQVLVIFLCLPVAALLNLYLLKLNNPKLSEPIETVAVDPQRTYARMPQTPETPPPAYDASADHPSTYADVQWSVRRDGSTPSDTVDDAAQFVKGSAALLVVIGVLFVVALAIQGLSWCDPLPSWFAVCLWVIYGGACLFALRGLGAWLVLFRNLWGKKGRERFVIRDDVIVRGLAAVACLPYRVAVAGVRSCQARMCGQAEIDEDVELGVTPSSARFPSAVRHETDESMLDKETRQEDCKQEEELLDTATAETRGLLAHQESSNSSH